MKPGINSACRLRLKVRRAILLLLFVWPTLLMMPGRVARAQAVTSPAPKKILLFHDYGLEEPVRVLFDKGFQSVIRSAQSESVEVYSETLDTYRHPDKSHTLLMRDYLRQKYAGFKFDVIVAWPQPALQFMLDYRDELFPGVPVVYLTFLRLDPAQIPHDFTGFWSGPKIKDTLDLALNLQPASEQVFVISGMVNNDGRLEGEARSQLKGFENRVSINYLIDLPLDETIAKVRNLPEHSVILYLRQARGFGDRRILADEAAGAIAQSTNVPTYGIIDSFIGNGVLGGKVVSLEWAGSEMAKIALRIANGARPEDIPVQEVPAVPIFDWRQLHRWGIAENRLPPGSIVRFKELTFWEQYKGRIVVALTIIFLQALLLVGLLIERRRKKQAEEELRASEQKYRYLVDTTPAFVHTALPTGDLDFFNHVWEEYVGVPLTDLVGLRWTTRIHPEDVEAFVGKWRAAVEAGEPFIGESRVRRADGEYRWFLQRSEPLRNEVGEIVKWYGSGIEIEERKIAEEKIRAQETELRQILNLAPQHIGVLAPDGSRLYANHTALEYFGMTLEQWCDPKIHLELAHPEDRDHFVYEREKRFLEGKPHEFEARLLRHDAEFRWFLFRLTPLKDEQGHITRWYGTATDIQDRKRAEEEIRKENIALREEIIKTSMFEEIVGHSSALQEVLVRVTKVAPTDSTVLITGETGTGKELIARAIHKASKRADHAFVSVNCAAIPQSLIASELFGHEKGAFTGATGRRLGRFELAEGGTIFLDEVGELPPETQVALLRVLQEREFERVGGNRSIKTNVRMIVATNRDLPDAIAAGTFRQDLFYRLNVFPIEIPPLRERREDIPMLVQYFIDRYARELGKNIRTVSKETLDLFQSYTWPGNIRELRNVIERSIIVCDTESFSVDQSWLSRQPLPAPSTSQLELRQRLADQEREAIEGALMESRGRVFGPSGAAARLGIARSTLESKIKTLNIDKNRFKLSSPS